MNFVCTNKWKYVGRNDLEELLFGEMTSTCRSRGNSCRSLSPAASLPRSAVSGAAHSSACKSHYSLLNNQVVTYPNRTTNLHNIFSTSIWRGKKCFWKYVKKVFKCRIMVAFEEVHTRSWEDVLEDLKHYLQRMLWRCSLGHLFSEDVANTLRRGWEDIKKIWSLFSRCSEDVKKRGKPLYKVHWNGSSVVFQLDSFRTVCNVSGDDSTHYFKKIMLSPQLNIFYS